MGPFVRWAVAAITYLGWCMFFLWEDVPLGWITHPVSLGVISAIYGYVLGFRAVALTLLWAVAVLFLTTGWGTEGDQGVALFFGMLIGGGGLLVGAIVAWGARLRMSASTRA